MAAGITERNQHCWRCATVNAAGDKFCQGCGASLVQRDNTTRYLCAAAQLSEVYANTAIREFLVEPLRAIPPAPGVDTTSVLREAVAARARRRIRDGVLLILLAALLIANPVLFVPWLVFALVVAMLLGRFVISRRSAIIAVVVVVIGAVLAAVLGTLGFAAFAIFSSLGSSSSSGSYGYPGGYPSGGYPSGGVDTSSGSGFLTLDLIITVLLLIAIVAVIVVDEFAVHYLVFNRFRRNDFLPDGRTSRHEWEARLRGLGLPTFQLPLNRVAATEQSGQRAGDADVVVHRGFSPFIGAGVPVHDQVIALALEPSDEDEAPEPISVTGLHDHITAAINRLRSTSTLGPGRRLEELVRREQVLIPADRLVIDHRTVPEILPTLDHAPSSRITTEQARSLADAAVEWARYYSCYRVEAWDRDLTTSCYVHAGTDQKMLFLEWQFFALLPIMPGFRAIDEYRDPLLAPIKSSLLEILVLPATIVRRAVSVFRRFKPLKQGVNEVMPAKYGADRSLREYAQADRVQSYFQDVDVERYVRILDSTLFRAVGEYLQERGYSAVEFMKLADPQVNNYNLQGSTLVDSAVGTGSSVNNKKG
ncbi:zinc ribbon domain-containing protein [Kutzneria chonburiensis]|uniref:Zinc ribbon domain-containing protein n=1 Tax=Kutzneria chonburiensis TaxID=1483604 RepID=A0ABV6N0S4_9PSEU|nr:zinc ribbon domain-containing protein [Kutzneria chonburiensis]